MTFRQPDTVETGDYSVFAVAIKYPGASLQTPTGYSHLETGVGGSAPNIENAGEINVTAYGRTCDGTEDASTETLTITGGNCALSRSICYGSSSGSAWDVATVFAPQATHVASWDTYANTTIDLAAGDILVGIVGKCSDAQGVHDSSHVVAMSGMTFGAVQSRSISTGATVTTLGDDAGIHIFETEVTSGSATGIVHTTIAWSGSGGANGGGILYVRLRESGASGSGAAAQYFNLL